MFGDDTKAPAGPAPPYLTGTVVDPARRVFSTMKSLIGADSNYGSSGNADGGPPKVPESLISKPVPASVDTPGRHKSLLGQ